MNFTDSIIKILEESDAPMTAADVRLAVLRMNPQIGHSTVPATLALLAKSGKIGKVQISSNRCRYYFLRGSAEGDAVTAPASNDARREDHVDVVDAEADDGPRAETAPVPYATSVATCIADAITFVIGSDSVASIRDFANRALDEFCVDKPWLRRGFFWVRCHGVNTIRISVTASAAKNPLAFQDLVRMYDQDFSEIHDPVIVRDGALASDAKSVNRSFFATTAIIWYLITKLSEEESGGEAVQRFLRYARENYVDMGDDAVNRAASNVVDAYLKIQRDIIADEERGRLRQSEIEIDMPQQRKEGTEPASFSSSFDLGANCKLVGVFRADDGGLNVTLHVPQVTAENLLRLISR